MARSAEEIVKIAMGRGFDEAVANVFTYRVSYLKIANSAVDSIVTKLENTANLFVSGKKRVFFTNIDRVEDGNIASAIKVAKETIPMLKPKEDYNGIVEGPFSYECKCIYQKKMANFDNKMMSDIAYAAINSALESGADSIAGTLEMTDFTKEMATSKDAAGTEKCAFARLSLRVFRKGLSAQKVVATKKIGEIKPEALGRTTTELASLTNEKGKVSNGNYDIIYMQQPAGLLLADVNDMACIGSVETGGFLTGKLHKEVANKNIKIYDDGKSPELIATSDFDDEGYPTQKTTLIEGGKLRGYLHNHSTAVKYKTKSTGNAGLVLPESNAFVMEHKKKARDIDALIRKIDRGILVTNTWYTRYSDYLVGNFSTVPRDAAIYIENGEPKFAIKQLGHTSGTGIRISDNIIRMLKNTECAADDSMQTASWDSGSNYYVTPSVLVRGVDVTVAH
ncbi:MAG: TldD/PmbA family protein [Candidatus Micrarchaeota archaeon]|nr:TldD/PmbA family protein [Candidatus Micrarchaeota archaeon]